MNPEPVSTPRKTAAKRVLPARPFSAAFVALAFTVLLYAVELIDVALPEDLDRNGIVAREVSGLDGVLWAPLLHAGWGHLVANTVPVLLFAFLAMSTGIRQWIAVTATIWLLSGLGVWLVGPPDAPTVGASGLAFGWLAYLLVRGVFNRSAAQLVLAVVLFVVYGGMFWGVLPVTPGVSWQGHLFGALAGVFAAWVVSRADKPRERPAATIAA